MKTRLVVLVLLLFGARPAPAGAWGGDVHRLINRSAVDCLPAELHDFAQWAGDLERLSTDADYRKDADPSESMRHYIDIDDYPQFFTGTLTHDYATMLSLYGRSRVEDNGIVPWAVRDTYDALVAAFAAHNWTLAVQKAADIGHYVGDLHNPLHDTMNYDGQLTGQKGLHSRFESNLTGRYLDQLVPIPKTATRVTDVLETTFEWIDAQYPGVQVILDADLAAKQQSGGSTRSDVYYEAMWEELGQYTSYWIDHAAVSVASLWYSAWLDAGSPELPESTPVERTTVGAIKARFAAASR